MTTQDGIQRAAELGLASKRIADIIISPHFHSVTYQVFTPSSPGRLFALFRHPVDRALSAYHYLAKASWDPHYNPRLAKMSVVEFAKSRYIENNWLTRFLVDKPGGKLTHADMLLAKKIIKFKCLVGLYEDIEVSMTRFQRYFRWKTDVSGAKMNQCRAGAVAHGDINVVHPEGTHVREGSKAWNAIVRTNVFDMELYEYAKKIYRIQGEQIFGVIGQYSMNEDRFGENDNMGDGGEGELPIMTEVSGFGRGSMRDAFDNEGYEQPRSGKSMDMDAMDDDRFRNRGSASASTDIYGAETEEGNERSVGRRQFRNYVAEAAEDYSTEQYLAEEDGRADFDHYDNAQ